MTDVQPPATIRLEPGREYFVNPGSVDASRKRAHKLAEFAVFDSGAGTVEFGNVAYDDATTEAHAASEGFRIDPVRDRLYDWRRRILAPAKWTIRKMLVRDS